MHLIIYVHVPHCISKSCSIFHTKRDLLHEYSLTINFQKLNTDSTFKLKTFTKQYVIIILNDALINYRA